MRTQKEIESTPNYTTRQRKDGPWTHEAEHSFQKLELLSA